MATKNAFRIDIVSPDRVEKQLELLRGGAPRRSPTVRALAAFAQVSSCNLAALGFVSGVDFDRLLAGTRFQMPFGQSPFAISRGLGFEKILRKDNYSATLELLRSLPGFPASAAVVKNLREGYPKNSSALPLRAKATRELVERIVRRESNAPNLIDGAVLVTPIGGVQAYFEADALAARMGREIHVGEVKSFPKVDERVDPDKLGAALDQVAIYILLTRDLVASIGGDPDQLVSDLALLITPKNVGLTPTLSEQRVSNRIARARKLINGIPRAEEVVASVPSKLSFGTVANKTADEGRRLDVLEELAERVGTDYKPSCLATCGNAKFCRSRVFKADSPCLSGQGAVRLLPGIDTLRRADELSRGASPKTGEAPVANILERAGRLYDGVAGPLLGAPHNRSRRRPA